MKKWYQSKIIQAAVIQIVAAAALALNTALTSGLGLKEAAIAMGSAALAALIIVFRKNTDTGISSAAKKPTGIGTACLGIAFAGLLVAGSGCGGVKKIADEYADEVNQLEKCALDCGVNIAYDALSCPLTGGGFEDILDAEVAKGMAKDAKLCILNCLLKQSVDIGLNLCK